MDYSKLSTLPYFMERFQEIVRDAPNSLMLVDARHPDGLTRAEVDEQSARIYAYLKQRGIGREDMVMICLPRGAEIAVAAIGVWKAGAACVLAEDDLPAERLAFIREDSGSVLTIDSALWPEIMQTAPLTGFARADDHDVAFALYTSGSTGTPKGVLQEYGCFRMYALTGPEFTQEPDEAYHETMIPPFHTMPGVNDAVKCMLSLDCLHILPYEIAKDPHRLNRYFSQHNISHTFIPPSALRAIGSALSPSVRFLAVGGEGANGLYLDGVTLENGYSMSEVCYPLCKFIIDRPYALCPVGKPASDVIALRLLTPDGQAAKPGETGEICFENPFFRGYINRPEETKEAFRGGLFHSGDLGRWDENGNLLVTGRVNEMLKIGGNRVEPGEIERVFRKLTGQDWCAVRGFTVGTRTLLCLYYQDEGGLDVRRVREEMRAYLPGYMIPSKFQRVETVPLLSSGKTDKAALPEPDFSENRPDYAPPVTEEETALCKAFERAFALEAVGLDDDFFDLGGDSLTAMSVIVEAELTSLSALDIYEGKTVRRIAEALAQRQAELLDEDPVVSEARERARLHPVPSDIIRVLAHEDPGDIHFPGLFRFELSVDAQKLCDAVNRAIANRALLSTVIETDSGGRPILHYAPSFTPRLEVQRLTEAEFEAKRAKLLQTFEMYGTPLLHAGVFETEQRVCLFLDAHHMIMDGSAMMLFWDDIEKAYHGQPMGQDTYFTYLGRLERERSSERYQKAKEAWLRLINDESWQIGFAPDQSDGPSEVAFLPCRRVMTKAEVQNLTERLGMRENLLCIGLTLLALTKLEGENNYLCDSVYHNRSDNVGRNAFGLLLAMVFVAAKVSKKSSIADFYAQLKASWIDSTANLRAGIDGMAASPRGLRILQASFQTYEATGRDVLSSLGAKREEVQNTMSGSMLEQGVLFYEQPNVIAPMLLVNKAHYSPEKQAAILDALTAVIDRLVALEDPERTTVGELLK